MAMFGSSWKEDDDGYDFNIFSHWGKDNYEYDTPSKPLSDEEILERMDVKTIENHLRKRKLKNINKSGKTRE